MDNGQYNPPIIRTKAERMRMEILIWIPTLICLITSTICEFPAVYTPYKESFTGLRLNMTDIRPEAVFLPAFQRVNYTNTFRIDFDRGDTELPVAYDLNEHGHRVDPHSGNVMASPMANGSYGYESLYKDFPRTLLYGGSPALFKGRLPIQGPDDVGVHIADLEQQIDKFYEKALVLGNDLRVNNLRFTISMIVVDIVLFVISMLYGGYGVVGVNTLLWFIKIFVMENNAASYMGEEEIFQSFRNTYRVYGLELTPINLTVPRYGGCIIYWAIIIGVFAGVLGVLEFAMNDSAQIDPDVKDPVITEAVLSERDIEYEINNIV